MVFTCSGLCRSVSVAICFSAFILFVMVASERPLRCMSIAKFISSSVMCVCVAGVAGVVVEWLGASTPAVLGAVRAAANMNLAASRTASPSPSLPSTTGGLKQTPTRSIDKPSRNSSAQQKNSCSATITGTSSQAGSL